MNTPQQKQWKLFVQTRGVFFVAVVVFLGEVLYAQTLPTPLYTFMNPEVPTDFEPVLKGPTPAEADRILAERLFCEARIREHSGDFSQALQKYERSWRLSQDRVILQNIVSLAAQEKRADEVVRYFSRMEHPEKMDALALRMAGLLIASRENVPQAIRAYEAALAVLPADVYPAIRVVLRDELGPLYYLSGDYDKAIGSMEYVLSALENPQRYGVDKEMQALLASEQVSLRYQLADMYLLKHEESRAEEMLAKAVAEEYQAVSGEKDEKEKRVQIQAREGFFRARIAASREKYEESLRLLEDVFAQKLRGEGNGPMELLEQVLKAVHRENELIGKLEKYHAHDGKNLELGYFLAKQYRRSKDWKRAWELLEKLTGQVPVMEGYVGLLEASWRQGNSENFLKAIYQILAQQDSEEPLMEAMKRLLGEQPKEEKPEETDQNVAEKEVKDDPSQAKKEPPEEETGELAWKGTPLEAFGQETFKRMVEKYPPENTNNPWPFNWAISVLARWLDQQELAVAYGDAVCQAILRKEYVKDQIPGKDFFIQYGLYLSKQERQEEAEKVFRQGVNTVPDKESKAILEYYLGTLFLADKQYERAEKELLEAIRLDGEFSLYLRQLGLVYYWEGRVEKAIPLYQKLLEKYGNDYSHSFKRELVQETRQTLSMLESYRGNMAEAEEQLECVLDEFPDDIGSRNDLAYLWSVQKKNLDRALKYSQEAVAAEPENYTYHDTLGWIYFQRGELEKAISCLEQSISMESDPVVYRHLGEVWLTKGNREKALEYYRKSRDAFLEAEKAGKLIDEKERKHVLEQLDSSHLGLGIVEPPLERRTMVSTVPKTENYSGIRIKILE